MDVELRPEGTLVVALTADDQARLQHQLAFQQKLGLPLQWISAAETRRREPHLAGKLAGAVFSPEDHQVDNRKLVAALAASPPKRPARSSASIAPVKAISSRGGRARGYRSRGRRPQVAADKVVLAAGAWSRSIEGLQPELRPRCGRSRGRCWRCAWIRPRRCLSHVRLGARRVSRAAPGRPLAGGSDRRGERL